VWSFSRAVELKAFRFFDGLVSHACVSGFSLIASISNLLILYDFVNQRMIQRRNLSHNVAGFIEFKGSVYVATKNVSSVEIIQVSPKIFEPTSFSVSITDKRCSSFQIIESSLSFLFGFADGSLVEYSILSSSTYKLVKFNQFNILECKYWHRNRKSLPSRFIDFCP
jgi:hypothetical protein